LPPNVERIADVSEEQVKDAVSKLNEYVQSTERTLDFQMDEESGKTIIKVFDKASSELIRQIPNELALELAQNLNDEEPSLLFSAQV
jgi:flagellar protein FlaG